MFTNLSIERGPHIVHFLAETVFQPTVAFLLGIPWPSVFGNLMGNPQVAHGLMDLGDL